MRYVFLLIISSFSMNSQVLFDFNKKSDIRNWRIIDDVVMGGRSQGDLELNADGHAVFKGVISLKNNGGFSSLRYRLARKLTNKNSKIIITLKGDGKEYQFRIKSNANDYYSYVTLFSTSGKWEEVEISLKDLFPAFRGRKLGLPNFSNGSFEEIAFLIGNKKEENFNLILDKITLK